DYITRIKPINESINNLNSRHTDTTNNISTPEYGTCQSTNTTSCMHQLHAEIDHDWKGASYCGPNTACDNNTLVAQTAAYKSLIDIQGFVFWDADHVNESYHNCAGWEIHPVTAWRIANTSSDFELSASPSSLAVLSSQSANSDITVNTFNLFTGSVSFSTTVSSTSNTVGAPPTATMNPSNVTVVSGGIANSKLRIATPASTLGNYTIRVTGTNGSLTRAVTVSVDIVDFGVTANPTSLSISIASSGTSTLTFTSLNGFSGSGSVTAKIAPSSLHAVLLPVEHIAFLRESD